MHQTKTVTTQTITMQDYIKKLQKSDFEEAYQLWSNHNLKVLEQNQEQSIFESTLEYNPETCFKVEYLGQIIGTILGTFDGRCGYVYRFCVNSKYQKHGIGSLLLDTVEQILLTKNCNQINLVIMDYKIEKLMPYYQKRGYILCDGELNLTKRQL
jgi:GNAT superfamily N-acetyltransferase